MLNKRHGGDARPAGIHLAQPQLPNVVRQAVARAEVAGAVGHAARIEVEDDGREVAFLGPLDGVLHLLLDLLDGLTRDRIGHRDEQTVLRRGILCARKRNAALGISKNRHPVYPPLFSGQ